MSGCVTPWAWLTGFTGSAGLAVVLVDKDAVFTDGRYVLQLANQTDAALWERLHITDQPPEVWGQFQTDFGVCAVFESSEQPVQFKRADERDGISQGAQSDRVEF